MLPLYFAYSGIVASVWIVLGIAIAGCRYQGYSHTKQFCSELGASGSPTEKFSPLINNYPLGLLFVIFGGYLIQLAPSSVLMIMVGTLIVLHGIGTWVAGYFPMDADPYTKTPSFQCKVHSWAGSVMFLSLLTASVLCLFINELSFSFKMLTIFSIFASMYFSYTLVKSFRNKTDPGTQQRLSYAAQLVWLSGLSFVIA
ncbi:DUF998 domain-containing protein [Shewanella sp. VB17]|uniref:DUF998 domain-containing protein n=1 Tax=Shewanella sp. VB17 TaxID=2739432 RepID=UPI00156507AA|nr:DUF998 domain-containing protein [Shewanella sp. VB17]NRD73876.1 DUF998 domain-containing protein [Shewanella sp. VB17]